ncbi:MAG: alpha/beta fold hydrolase [Pseudomonadota bacterium]
MLRIFLYVLGVIIIIGLIGSFVITRGGKLVTPVGEGEIVIGDKTFEAFPLPDYAQAFVTEDYKSYFIEVEPGIKVHMLEVGTGFPVFMQHGNPSSGFLYRKVVEQLPTDRVRIIMPTLVGLGFSSKVPVESHTVINHNRWLNKALTELELEELVYVGQDWGGIVGVGALSLSPELVQGIVIMNTAIYAPTEKMKLSRLHDLVRTPIVGEFLIEVLGSAFDGMDRVQGDQDSIPAEVKALYGRPVEDSGNIKAPLAMMRMVPHAPEHPSTAPMAELVTYVRGLDVPTEIVWGINDPIIGQGVPPMREHFPNARVTETEAGHFLQEEVPEVIAEAVLRVVNQVQASAEAVPETVLDTAAEPGRDDADIPGALARP